jgi:hypothetical protein
MNGWLLALAAVLFAATLRWGARAGWRWGGRAWPRGDTVALGAEGEPLLQVRGFRVVELLGQGGMARVYRAERESDGSVVALKVPTDAYIADAKFIRRFHQEAELAQRFDHPNVVRTFEHGSNGLQHHMAMEFVDGVVLEELLETGPLELEAALQVLHQLALGLEHIHQRQVIHRDVKAGNVMVTRAALARLRSGLPLEPGSVKLMDFGIAAAGPRISSRTPGTRVGTPVSMSPEQARGLPIDQRADIYALGLLGYRLLVGLHPFRGHHEAIVQQQIHQRPAPLREVQPGVPVRFDELITAMLEKEPAKRPELQQAIATFDPERRAIGEGEAPRGVLCALLRREGDPLVTYERASEQGEPAQWPVPFHIPFSAHAVARDRRGEWTLLTQVGSERGAGFLVRLSAEGRLLQRFGRRGSGVGDLSNPIDVASAPDGSILVLDHETHRVLRFESDGGFIAAFGGRGPGRGSFHDPRAIAVGPDGMVYVLDAGHRQIQRLHPDGRYDTRWAFRMERGAGELRPLNGLHVGRSGTLYIGDASSQRIRSIDPAGHLGAVFTFPPERDDLVGRSLLIASDEAGRLYVAWRGGSRVELFDADGTLREVQTAPAALVALLITQAAGSQQAPAATAPMNA